MEINNIIIRQARSNDIEAIAEIKVTGWQAAYKGIIDDENLSSMSVSRQIETLKKAYSLENIFVAENDNEILGFCRVCGYDNPLYRDKEIDCEIREIYVRPGIKRMGVGSKLFSYTLNRFKQNGRKKLHLGCFKENSTKKWAEFLKRGRILMFLGNLSDGILCL